MEVLIVESPTKERTISRFLSKNFVVKSSYGHVRDLPKKKLGVDVKKEFAPQYVVIPKAKKIIAQLEEVVKKAKKVYIGTDFDREGEAIAWHLADVLKLDLKKTSRITFHEITPEAIKEAIKTARQIDFNLVNSQQARRVLDRLVGYKLSPLLWEKVQRGLSAGRVQSVAVKIVCDREEEIKKFTAREYWTVKVELRKDAVSPAGEQEHFIAELVKRNGTKLDKFDIATKEEADAIVKDIQGQSFKVEAIKRREKKRRPNGPFTTASLQQEASRIFRFSPSRTMFIAQTLYEGVPIGDQSEIGLITYMRTDSMNIAGVAQEEARTFITDKFGKEFLPQKPRVFKTKLKTAQEAHEAIRPTSVLREPSAIKEYLTVDQNKLYTLIWARFAASQMADAVYDTISADINAGNMMFRTNGRILKFPGFLKVFMEYESERSEDVMLPDLKEADVLHHIKNIPEQHFTEPPPKFSEASLIKELEKNAIGRPSTYAPIVETIVNRRYVTLDNHRFTPTDLGIIVNDILKQHFNEIVDINFTAQIEDKLDAIAQGDVAWNTVINEFYGPFAKKLEVAKEKIEKRKMYTVTDEKCPKCGEVMYLRESRYGKFLSCSKWPKCRSKVSLDRSGHRKVVEKTGEECPECGKDLLKRTGRKGPFIACSGYPKCKFTKNIENPDTDVSDNKEKQSS